jgi:exonuclease 3'-5' domain-containing protein 1
MANEIDDYILCDDNSSLADAIAAIQPASVLVLDCEGKTLGIEGGTLSLIILRALEPKISKTYLIDTISLTKDQLNPIFNILRSSSVTKIMFDGRKDFCELYHGCNVYLRGVLDLQLADVDSRRQLRGENQWKQISRLLGFLPGREVYKKQYFYSAVQKLSGLEGCIGEHKIIKVQKNDPSEDGFNLVIREVYPDTL